MFDTDLPEFASNSFVFKSDQSQSYQILQKDATLLSLFNRIYIKM